MQSNFTKHIHYGLFLFFFSFSLLALASTNDGTPNGVKLEGKVRDSKTKEILIGASIYVKNTKLNTATNLEGEFKIRGITPGKYIVGCNYVGYKNQEKEVEIKQGEKEVEIKFLMESTSTEIDEISVRDSSINKESDLFSRKTEMNAPSIINSVSAKAIQISPDLTVANVLQRVSGVSIERSSTGDGQYAIIRGMDKRYNYTLVNGIKIPSPDPKNRYVPMDIFPSDLLERLEVIKALTPSMEGDAIGGAMNMVMKNAPDKLLVNANVAIGYSQLLFDRGYNSYDFKSSNPKSPIEINGPNYKPVGSDFPNSSMKYTDITAPTNSMFGVTLGNRFFNKKLGVLVAGSYANNYRATNSFVVLPNASTQADPAPGNAPAMNFVQSRNYSTQQTRIGLNAKIDYQINKKNKISFYNLLVQLNEASVRTIIDSDWQIHRTGPAQTIVTRYYRFKQTNQTIYNGTLHGDHDISSNLKVDWIGAYSVASSQTPDWTQWDNQYQSYKPDSTGAASATINKAHHYWMHNTDKDLSGYVNVTYTPHIFKTDIEIKVGGMYRHKTRDNFYDETVLNSAVASTKFNNNDYNNSIDQITWKLYSNTSANDANNYTFNEDISAYYGQLKFTPITKLQLIGGVRVENTSQSFETAIPITQAGKTGSKTYMDILPSFHLKYSLTKNQNIRASYYASISRPSYYEIIPFTITGEYFDESGNPLLKHTQANNYDIRYEFLGKGLDQILFGVFYKDIINPVEYAYFQNGISNTILKPTNYGNAVNFGFEAVVTKYIGYFGASVNYTYTNSSITVNRTFVTRNSYPSGSITNYQVSETRPLQGQSAHIGNASLLYKNSKLGLDVQLALVYTGSRINLISQYAGQDYWQRAMTTMDFSMEKRLYKRISIYCKIGNILNTPYILEIRQHNIYRTGISALPNQDSDDSIIVQKDYYGQTYLLGLRFKL